MKCSNCLKELPENLPSGIAFCPFCGKKMEPSKCPGCGEPIVEGAAFCYKCGYKIKASKASNPFTAQPLDELFEEDEESFEFEQYFESEKSEANTKPVKPINPFGYSDNAPKAQSDEKHFNTISCVDDSIKLFEQKHGKIDCVSGKFRVSTADQEIQNVVESWGLGGTTKHPQKNRKQILDGCNGYYITDKFGEINCAAVCEYTGKTFYAKGKSVYSADSKSCIIDTNGSVCSMFYCDGILSVTSLIDIQDKGYHQEEWQQGDFGRYYYQYAAKLETSFYRITGNSADFICSSKNISAIRSGFFLKSDPNVLQMMDYNCSLYDLDTKQKTLKIVISSEKFEHDFPFPKFNFGFRDHKRSIVWYCFNKDFQELYVWNNGNIVKLKPNDPNQNKWQGSLFSHPSNDAVTC